MQSLERLTVIPYVAESDLVVIDGVQHGQHFEAFVKLALHLL